MKGKTVILFWICFLWFGCQSVLSQQYKIKTSVDSTKVKLGKLIHLKLQTQVDTFSKVQFPEIPMIGNLEVIENYPVDTFRKGALYELVKKYGITQFDSGVYTIPRLAVFINQKPYFSDSLQVEITNVAVDTLKQHLYDIKDILEAPKTSSNWWKWLLGLLALVLLFFAGKKGWEYYLFKKSGQIIYKTPIEKALALLKQLDQKKLLEKGEVKTFYSEMTDITRNYLEESLEIPAMESTTNELMTLLQQVVKQKKYPFSKELLQNLEKILKQADLVKFAKSQPFILEIKEDKQKMEEIVKSFHQALPKKPEEEEALFEEEEKAAKAKKAKTKYILIATAAVVLIIFGFAWFTNGFGLLGTSTKKMLEKEWITSDYGFPAVRISSPEVLERNEIKIPPTLESIIQEQTSFTMGSLQSLFFTQIKTTFLKTKPEENLNDAILESELKILEQLGASTLLVKTDDFSLGQGTTGKRNQGTFRFAVPGSGKQVTCRYEMYLFQQEQSIQQFTLVYQEEDTYGKAIAEKMLKSIELRKSP